MPIELPGAGEPSGKFRRRGNVAALVAGVLLLCGIYASWGHLGTTVSPNCTQPPVVAPQQDVYDNSTIFLSPEYKQKSAEILGAAVRIPTEAYDDMPFDPREDSRFEIFNEFHAYLNKTFPKVSELVERVNLYGLLYTIQGEDPDLPPVVLMAHQDVVPVNPQTVHQWTHPPYSGYFDGEYVWGRGSADTKNSLIAILEAVESLLAQDWTPARTVLLSFGYDEEVGGPRGAASLAEEIEARYGVDSIHFIVDEGTGLWYESGALYALPTIAERGYADIRLRVETPGGHSSMPPDHTGIGIASEVVRRLENVDLFQPYLSETHPLVMQLGCYAAHSPLLDDSSRSKWSNLAASSRQRHSLAKEFSHDRRGRAYVATTQAVDVVSGGVKVNALPELVEVTANYRISLDSSVQDVTNRYMHLASSVATEYGLGLVLNNETVIPATAAGLLRVDNFNSLEPVGNSPSSGPIWDLLGGTTRHIYETILEMGPVYFSPTLNSGNTDTAHFSRLTRNIYRYRPVLLMDSNAHTVNEHSSIDGHVSMLMWYYELLQVLH